MADQGPLEPIFHVYYGYDRKLPEVQLEDGTWCDAEIRMWARDATGAWTAHVAWSGGPGQDARLDKFPAARLRPQPE